MISCSNKNTAVLWSNTKEAVSIVEQYNKNNKEYRIIFQYRENLTAAYINADKKPDIIIGWDLQNKEIKSELLKLDNFFYDNFPDENEINQSLMEGVYLNEEKHLIPLSYSLTTAVFNKNSKRIDQELPSIEIEQMIKDSTSYNDEQKKRGYSPLWDVNFICAVLELYGSSFTSSETDSLQWNEKELQRAMDLILEWNRLNGGKDEMALFNAKYMYDNRIKILKDERILFSTMNISDFMKLSDSMSKDLNFLYISHNYTLNPENIVYGGINKKTRALKTSTDFLSWLLNSETQRQIIEESLKNKSQSFGILGGFSSLEDFNCSTLPQYYPRLNGKIPDSRYIRHEMERPVEYNSIKNDLIATWAIKKVEGDNISLTDALEKWEKLRIPF